MPPSPRRHIAAALRDLVDVVRYQQRRWQPNRRTGALSRTRSMPEHQPHALLALADDMQIVMERAADLRGYALTEHDRLVDP